LTSAALEHDTFTFGYLPTAWRAGIHDYYEEYLCTFVLPS